MSTAARQPGGKSSPSLLPKCVFMAHAKELTQGIQNDLIEAKVEPIHVTSLEELLLEVDEPDVFLVFVSLSFFPQIISYMQKNRKLHNCFFIAVADNMNGHQIDRLYDLGFVDVLSKPVHHFTYRSRALQILSRYVRQFGIPEKTLLPDDVPRVAVHVEKEESLDKPKFVHEFGELKNIGEGKLNFYEKSRNRLAPIEENIKQLDDHRNLLKMYQEAAQSECRAMVWIAKQKWKQEFVVSSFDPDRLSLRLRCPKAWIPESLKTLFQTEGVSQIFVSLELRRARIFLSGPYSPSNVSNDGLIVSCEDRAFQSQRRRDFRLTNGDGSILVAKLKLRGVEGDFDLVFADISAGGAGVVIPEKLVGKFYQESKLDHLSFQIYGITINCSAKVRWVKDGKAGIQFHRMDEKDKEGIQLFVFEESYNYLSQSFGY